MIDLSVNSTDDSKSRESDFQPTKKSVQKRKPISKKPSAGSEKTAKKAKKPPKTTPAAVVNDCDAKALILKIINGKNRPFSHVQICDMVKEIKKSKVTALLDAMEAEQKVAQKTFKKTKIYFPKPVSLKKNLKIK